jgi:hypothetical protein
MTMPCFIHDGYTAVAVVVVIVGLLLLASWGQALVLPMTTLGCGDKPHMLTYLHHEMRSKQSLRIITKTSARMSSLIANYTASSATHRTTS